MNHIINFEDISTYPKCILEFLSNAPFLQYIYEYTQIVDADFAYCIKEHFDGADCLITGIRQDLQDWGFIAYHITRVADIESIKQHGLKIMTFCEYMNRMEYVFQHILNYTYDEVDRYKNVLREKLIREKACRIGQLSFFAPPSKYNLEERDNGYLSLYGLVVGGEVAKQAFQGNKKVFSDLHKLGRTFLIKAKFNILTLLEHCENDAEGFIYSLLYLAAQCHYSKHLNDDAIIIGQVNQSVPPEDICEIIPIDDIE